MQLVYCSQSSTSVSGQGHVWTPRSVSKGAVLAGAHHLRSQRDRDQLAARNLELEKMLERSKGDPLTSCLDAMDPHFPVWTHQPISSGTPMEPHFFSSTSSMGLVPQEPVGDWDTGSTSMSAFDSGAQTNLQSFSSLDEPPLTGLPVPISSSNPPRPQDYDSPKNDSGTLVAAPGQRYIHLGPSAGMQWLRHVRIQFCVRLKADSYRTFEVVSSPAPRHRPGFQNHGMQTRAQSMGHSVNSYPHNNPRPTEIYLTFCPAAGLPKGSSTITSDVSLGLARH